MTVPMTTIISICVAIITGSFSIFFGIKSKGKSDNHELIENTRITTELAMTLKEVAKNVEKIMNEMTDTKERMLLFSTLNDAAFFILNGAVSA